MADRSEVQDTFRASEWLLRVAAPPCIGAQCSGTGFVAGHTRDPHFAQTDCGKQADGLRTCHPAGVRVTPLCCIPALTIDAVDSALGVVVPLIAYPAEHQAITP